MGTESLVFAEVVAMSFIAHICKRTFKKFKKYNIWSLKKMYQQTKYAFASEEIQYL